MFNLVGIAIRNLTRSKARNAITLGAILLGVLMTLYLSSYMKGLQTAFVQDTVEGRLGAIQVHRKGYLELKENQPLKLDLPVSGEMVERVRGVEGVKGVAPRIVFSGMVSNGSTSTIFMGQAVAPTDEAQVLPKARENLEGKALDDEQPQGVIMGSELASALGLSPGSTVILQAATQKGQENALDGEVRGTQGTGSMLETKRLVTLPLAYAQRLLRMQGRATEYAVGVEKLDDIDVVADRIRVALGADYEVHTWRQLRPAIADILQVQMTVLSIICMIFLVITVFGVANTLLMSVMERRREIGTMMAVGVTRRQIATLFVLEAAVQAVLGGLVGTLLAFVLVQYLSSGGGMTLKIPGGSAAMHVLPVITGPWVARALIGSTLGAIFAALYPALKAASLRPVEALRST
jgi:putative ABC transport system permease protein